VLMWKRRESEQNEEAARKAKQAVRRAAIDGTLRDAGGGRVCELLRGADYECGLALVGSDEEGLGWKIVVAGVEKDETGEFAGISRLVARPVLPEEIQGGRVHIEHLGTNTRRGGVRGTEVSSVALELRTTMKHMPSTFISIMNEATSSGEDAQAQAVSKAYRWEGILMALRAQRVRLSPSQRLERLGAAHDQGLLSREEYDQLRDVHEARQSRSLNS